MFDRLLSFLQGLPAGGDSGRESDKDDPRIAATALMLHVIDADGIRQDSEKVRLKELLAATYETKKSYEGSSYGKFTEALLAVWGEGRFKGNYEEFIDEVREVAGRKQTAMLFDSGAHCPDFDKENPFTI